MAATEAPDERGRWRLEGHNVSKRWIGGGSLFNFLASEDAVRVSKRQQSQHHLVWELMADPFAGWTILRRQGRDRFENSCDLDKFWADLLEATIFSIVTNLSFLRMHVRSFRSETSVPEQRLTHVCYETVTARQRWGDDLQNRTSEDTLAAEGSESRPTDYDDVTDISRMRPLHRVGTFRAFSPATLETDS